MDKPSSQALEAGSDPEGAGDHAEDHLAAIDEAIQRSHAAQADTKKAADELVKRLEEMRARTAELDEMWRKMKP